MRRQAVDAVTPLPVIGVATLEDGREAIIVRGNTMARPAASSEWNPHGIVALRDTVFIKREEDLTDVRQADKLLAHPELVAIRARFLAERATGCGIVIAAGPGEYQNGVLIPQEVQVGDRVIFGPYTGADLKLPEDLGKEGYFTIYGKDIRGILPPKSR